MRESLLFCLVIWYWRMRAASGIPGLYYNSTGHLKKGTAYSTELWLPMTESEALDFYTPHEICSFAHSADGCKGTPGDLNNCNAFGQGVKHKCSNPSGNFMRFHTHLPHPHSQGVADVLIKMKKEQQPRNTMVIIGDSLSRQFMFDARCGLLRAGFAVEVNTNFDGVRVLNRSTVTAAAETTTPIASQKAAEKSAASEHQGVNCARGQPHNFFQIVFKPFPVNNSTLDSIAQDLLEMASDPCLVQGKLLIIVNVGLHYRGHKSIKPYMDLLRYSLVPALKKMAKENHTTIFRETSAQHFPDTHDGAFSGDYVRKDNVFEASKKVLVSTIAEKSGLFASSASSEQESHQQQQQIPPVSISSRSHPRLSFFCEPIASTQATELQNWRNSALVSILKELDPVGQIKISPFFHVSVGRHDYHVASNGDCTHFCSGPMLWQPVWQSVYSFL